MKTSHPGLHEILVIPAQSWAKAYFSRYIFVISRS